jgi:hypothetical protein
MRKIIISLGLVIGLNGITATDHTVTLQYEREHITIGSRGDRISIRELIASFKTKHPIPRGHCVQILDKDSQSPFPLEQKLKIADNLTLLVRLVKEAEESDHDRRAKPARGKRK